MAGLGAGGIEIRTGLESVSWQVAAAMSSRGTGGFCNSPGRSWTAYHSFLLPAQALHAPPKVVVESLRRYQSAYQRFDVLVRASHGRAGNDIDYS